MSATVDTKSVKKQLTNKTALSTGIFLQFAVLPCIGFVVVKIFKLSKSTGIILLVVTSSPGGSYSNWYVNFSKIFAFILAITTNFS
jgi:predicted Na+-dependent transporter